MKSYIAVVNEQFGKELFQALFLAATVAGILTWNFMVDEVARHPVMIKWCLHLHRSSSKAYGMVRKTGVFHLPSGRTLRDYTHFAPATCGFNTSSDEQLLEAANKMKPHHLSK